VKARLAILAVFIIISLVIVAAFTSFGFGQSGDRYAVEVTAWSSNDVGPDPPDFDKDVASCSGSLEDTDTPPDSLADHFAFTIDNGYPGYECTFNLTVHNAGNVTLTITGIDIHSSAPATEVAVAVSQPATPWTLAPDDESAGGNDEVVVVFKVTLLQGATPNTSYDITGAIKVESAGNP
jgi:hypothetical protein